MRIYRGCQGRCTPIEREQLQNRSSDASGGGEERNSLLLEVTLMLEVAASLRVENEISL